MCIPQMHTASIGFITAEKFLGDKAESFSRRFFLGDEPAERNTSGTHITILSASRIFGECTVNATPSAPAVISTKGPVRPTRIIYLLLKGDVRAANEITMTHCACNELVELRALCLRTCHLYSECIWYSRPMKRHIAWFKREEVLIILRGVS